MPTPLPSQAEDVLRDLFGRRSRTLRVSVTDRCNFRCTYCMPGEDMQWFPREGILSFEELERLVGLLVRAGVRRVRLTGGEPLVRRDLPVLVERLARMTRGQQARMKRRGETETEAAGLGALESLSLTTNGVLLPRHAAELRAAGLGSVNVSLDSLDAENFQRLTRRDALAGVLAGIEAARRAGLEPLKVNCVVVRGVNDHEAVAFARFARERDLAVRFIEWMPLDGGGGWGRDRVVPGAEVKAAIEAVFPLEPRPERPEAPARPYRFADGAPGEIGFINPVTAPFCGTCDRLRLTADGRVKNCMFDRGEVDVLGPLRRGADDAELLGLFASSVRSKGPGGLLETREVAAYAGLRNMSRLGG